jgi:non-ribosomal peptide synthetase component F
MRSRRPARAPLASDALQSMISSMGPRIRHRPSPPSRAKRNIRWAAITMLALSLAPAASPELERADADPALAAETARVAAGLRDAGVTAGDRVAGFMPNLPETLIAMLATTSLGAIWSSCSPDFGIAGVLDRFGQIAPKVIVTADG